MNGAEPTLNGTNAAATPIDVPTIVLVNGIIQTMRMINGIERKILTIIDTIWCDILFSNNWPFLVRKRKIPVGNPKTNPKNPETKVITTVSIVP